MNYKRIGTIGYCRSNKTYCVTVIRELDYELVFFKSKELTDKEIEQKINEL